MGTRGTTEGARRTDAETPKLGLRFDRGRTELVLDAPITLADGLRLDAMRTELAPLEGRLSLTEGWRAFRHRRSTLVSARVSIGLRELGSHIGEALGLDVHAIAVDARTLSLTASSEALAIAVELEWGWDDEDPLLAVSGARALPLGPRAPLALVHDLAASAGATFDRERGVLRITRPLRGVLVNALVPAGLRVPASAGLAMHGLVEGDRLVVVAERAAGGRPQGSREALERARARAPEIAELLERGGPAPEDGSAIVLAASALAAELTAEPVATARLAAAADDYAARERHASMASTGLLLAAERASSSRPLASRLAIAAIERGGLTRSSALARAIELSAGGPDARTLPWEHLSRELEGGGPVVQRARALALESAGRLADALTTFADVVRAQPTDVIAQRGLARTLDRLGRHDEAISAWDRVHALSEGEAATEAKLRAARATLAAGHVEGSLSRLRALVAADAANASPTLLQAHAELAQSLALHGRLREALEVDRSLAVITDRLGGIDASESAAALRTAFARALDASDLELARAHLRALGRTLGDAGVSEIAAHGEELANADARSLASAEPGALRARADAFRAGGQHVEAARVLVEVFAQTKDAAVLRAAIELADRAVDASARLAVFDRALALLPPGPARDAIAARR